MESEEQSVTKNNSKSSNYKPEAPSTKDVNVDKTSTITTNKVQSSSQPNSTQLTKQAVPNFFKNQVSHEQIAGNPSNRIKSTRYTWWSFLPVTVAMQLTKVIVVFFLINTTLQFIPSISTNSPMASLIPTLFIIIMGIIKEFVSEMKHYNTDKQVNQQKYNIMKSVQGSNESKLSFEVRRCDQIQVGDVIELSDDQIIPADCLLLKTQLAQAECFVQTSQLDGEHNLKPKLACKFIHNNFDTIFGKQADDASVKIRYSQAEKDIYRFRGRLEASLNGQNHQFELDINQFLHRGAMIKNSEKVLALVIYTGLETKLLMNLGKYQFKFSQNDIRYNYINLFMFITMLTFAGLLTVGNKVFNSNNYDTHKYIFEDEESPDKLTGLSFLSFWLILNMFLPLDLVVAIELAKLVYTPFIEADAFMKSADLSAGGRIIGCKAQSITLHEELGEIDYVFSDKTGTITQNELRFRCLTAMGTKFAGENNELAGIIAQRNLPQNQKCDLEELLRCISLCQDCITIKVGGKELYTGPSMDEQCLLDMAKEAKVCYFVDRDSESVRLQLGSKETNEERHQILKVFPFTSERKTMTVITHQQNSNKFYAYTKGADDVVKNLCSEKHEETIEQVNEFASQGLRTLMFARKELGSNLTHDDIERITQDQAETDMVMLGATGVEDLLQEDVRKCLSDFREAEIKVWMLTGDKGLTAYQIGKTCGMLDSNTEHEHHFLIQDMKILEDLYPKMKEAQEQKDNKKYSLLIAGTCTQEMLESDHWKQQMFPILRDASSVIVYRASPNQKAEMVNLIRRNVKGKRTLAIGDGANDINMIQSAHVGVGIYGKEGNAAASFSDYAIPKFKHLRRLMFWHGTNFGHNLSSFMFWCVFKSCLQATCMAFLNVNNGFSGFQPIQGIMFWGYNVFLTNFANAWYAIFNQQISFRKHGWNYEKDLSFKLSEYYIYNRNKQKQFYRNMLVQFGAAIVYGAIIFYVFSYSTDLEPATQDGQMQGMFTYGLFAIIVCVSVHHMQIGLQVRHWNIVYTLIFIGSWLLMWLSLSVYESNKANSLVGHVYQGIFREPLFWLKLILIIGIAFFVIVGIKNVQLVLREQSKFVSKN